MSLKTRFEELSEQDQLTLVAEMERGTSIGPMWKEDEGRQPPLVHIIAETGIRTREQALERFFRFLEDHNGHRRRSPRDFVRVLSCRRDREHGVWRISYRVPREYRSGV